MSATKDPSTKTCYACKNFDLCFARRLMWEAILSCGSMLDERTCLSILKDVGEHCQRFEKLLVN